MPVGWGVSSLPASLHREPAAIDQDAADSVCIAKIDREVALVKMVKIFCFSPEISYICSPFWAFGPSKRM